MNPDQATELAKRIINTMRPTPALPEWVEVLQPLDLDEALVTFKILRDGTDGGMTIGRYLGSYRGRLEARREARRFEAPPPHCELCDGTGWVDAPAELAHRSTTCRAEVATEQCRCSALEPCRCTRGQRAAGVHERIARANGWRAALPDRHAVTTPPSAHLFEEF